MMTRKQYLFILLATTFLACSDAKASDLKCGACHMLVDEIRWEISQTDPKRTIQVGSFRIMPDGSQRLNEIPYKKSGVQIAELLETACASPNNYYESTDDAFGRKLYKRQSRRDGKAVSLRNFGISKEITKMLKFTCEGIAEDFEDEFTEAFKNKEPEDYLQSVCVEIAEVCSTDQLYDVEPDVAEEPAASDTQSDEDDSEDDSEEEEDNSEEEVEGTNDTSGGDRIEL